MSHQLKFEQWVPFPVEHVFAFFSNPENLPRMMPASTGAKLTRINRITPTLPACEVSEQVRANAAGTGSTIRISFFIFPLLRIGAQWVSRITEFEWNHHFCDVQDEGPFKEWHHRHQFVRDLRDGIHGTLVVDAVDYELGFGVAGRIANRLFVSQQMQKTFAHRQQVLARLLSQRGVP